MPLAVAELQGCCYLVRLDMLAHAGTCLAPQRFLAFDSALSPVACAWASTSQLQVRCWYGPAPSTVSMPQQHPVCVRLLPRNRSCSMLLVAAAVCGQLQGGRAMNSLHMVW